MMGRLNFFQSLLAETREDRNHQQAYMARTLKDRRIHAVFR